MFNNKQQLSKFIPKLFLFATFVLSLWESDVLAYGLVTNHFKRIGV